MFDVYDPAPIFYSLGHRWQKGAKGSAFKNPPISKACIKPVSPTASLCVHPALYAPGTSSEHTTGRFGGTPYINGWDPRRQYLRNRTLGTKKTTYTHEIYKPWLLEPSLSWTLEPECRIHCMFQLHKYTYDTVLQGSLYACVVLPALWKSWDRGSSS